MVYIIDPFVNGHLYLPKYVGCSNTVGCYAILQLILADYIKQIATLIRCFAHFCATIVTQMSYRLVSPWLLRHYVKYAR